VTKRWVIADEIMTWFTSRADRKHQIVTTCSGLINQLTTMTVTYIEYARTIRDNMKSDS